ncbi:hypothetical protein scyTo_0010230 [Scyliorhinus torazame]|uniref:Uncharacterized protein n=1 Tax=Scyliorhinus torazame TaxID=75743 RepID=A0A401P290_SCYTO|nr:hypothetical protein [Scyliorhinus torazame]
MEPTNELLCICVTNLFPLMLLMLMKSEKEIKQFSLTTTQEEKEEEIRSLQKPLRKFLIVTEREKKEEWEETQERQV